MEQYDDFHIKQETIDGQNETFRIKEECILQWVDSPGDIQIKVENPNSKTDPVTVDNQNERFELEQECILQSHGSSRILQRDDAQCQTKEEPNYFKECEYNVEFKTEVETHDSHKGTLTLGHNKFNNLNGNEDNNMDNVNMPKSNDCQNSDGNMEERANSVTTCGTSGNIDDGLAHIETDTGDKSYVCDICGKELRWPRQLERHKWVHEKSFKCDTCGKEFTHSHLLKQHLKVHKEKQYKCNICRKQFHHSSQLKIHRQIHTGEEPYQCNICGKAFTVNSKLTNHKKICIRKNLCKSTDYSNVSKDNDKDRSGTLENTARTTRSAGT